VIYLQDLKGGGERGVLNAGCGAAAFLRRFPGKAFVNSEPRGVSRPAVTAMFKTTVNLYMPRKDDFFDL
jgi:hypothetical protein